MKFSDLNLIDPLVAALSNKGYTEPTPIQQQAIPSLLEGKDIFDPIAFSVIKIISGKVLNYFF